MFSILIVASVAVFAYNIVMTWISGERAPNNPWGARTLEWMTTSPPPLENFDRIPVVTSGPYDYGLGLPPLMATPAMAGGSVDAIADDHGVAVIDLPGHPRAVRIAAIMLVISDITFGLAMAMGFIYLHGLHTQNAFRGPGEPAPIVIWTVLTGVFAVLGGIAYRWGRLGLNSGAVGRVRAGVTVAWLLMAASLITNMIGYDKLPYQAPLHAYASGIMFMMIYGAVHVLLLLTIGGLMIGRLRSGRLNGRGYVVQATGYLFYWVAISAVIVMALTLVVS